MGSSLDRRTAIRTSALGFLGLTYTFSSTKAGKAEPKMNTIPDHFPYIDPEIVSDVVGKSHFDLEAVKKLVDERPELARSAWDWRFGDFESAVGAASHVGRRDIALYLIGKGARPTIFTHAMLGQLEIVKATIESVPGIQRTMGPHGISLLDHAYAGEHMKDKMTSLEVENVQRTIEYLENLGDAGGEDYVTLSAGEQTKYLGDYKYGEKEHEGFSIKLNMRKLMALAPIGEFGGALYKSGDNKFFYNGSPSVQVTFDIENEIVKSLTLSEPGLSLKAEKVS